jgi:hypothetical protein
MGILAALKAEVSMGQVTCEGMLSGESWYADIQGTEVAIKNFAIDARDFRQ